MLDTPFKILAKNSETLKDKRKRVLFLVCRLENRKKIGKCIIFNIK